MKQSLGCIAHSRSLPWLAYCFRSGPSGGGELDKLDGLDQAREALLGRFPGWEALRKFFSMNTDTILIQRLSRSDLYADYQKAFEDATDRKIG